jgi:putative ABC transport system permease protein
VGPRRRLFRVGLGQPDPSRAVDWEIEHYLAEQTDRLIAEGWGEADARREAERRFGNLARQRRRIVAADRKGRTMRTVAQWWETTWSGAAQALRGIRRSPGLAVGVILTLGLGIGVNAAMFGVLDRLLLRPPDHVAHPDQVRRILREGQWFGQFTTTGAQTYADIEDLRSIPQFASVGAFTGTRRLTLGAGEHARQVRTVLATPDFFTTLGVRPRLGRFFAKEDDVIGAAPTAVLSAEFWQRSFGADPDILGHTLELSGNPYTVIGVAPRGFTGVDLTPVDIWLPAVLSRYLTDQSDLFMTARGYYWLRAVVRIADGASVEAGEARATVLNVNARADAIRRGYYDARSRVFTAPLIAARGPVVDNTSRVARWLAGVALAVLLIACANVANLLLAQGIRRKREVAVRLALGVARSRLLVGTAVESLVLAGLGGLGALAVARWGGRFMQRLLMPDVLWSAGLDGRVVAVTALLAVGAGLLAGLGPAIQSTRADLSRDLLEGGRGASLRRSGVRRALTVAQTALSAVLLVGAGLFVRSLHEAGAVDLGLDADRLVLATLEFRNPALEAQEQNRLYEEAMERVRGLVPGAANLAATDNAFQSLSVASLRLPGVDSLPIPPGRGPVYFSVTPGFFETVGLHILRGRSIQRTDVEGAPRVAVVNRTMARVLWPASDALGQCLYFNDQDVCTTVVGLVQDAYTGTNGLEEEPFPAYYLPLAQTGFAAAGLYVRASDDAGAVAGAVAPILRSFSPAVRFAEVQTLDEILAPERRSWMLGASLFTAFGLLALLVAATGLYSLLAFDLAQRTREVGIRSALGASRARLLWETMRQGAGLVAIGTLVGLGICLVAAPYVEPLLFHVAGREPMVLATAVGVLLAVGGLASLPPGIRSTRVDPAEALRME